jgi:hypothetical protein
MGSTADLVEVGGRQKALMEWTAPFIQRSHNGPETMRQKHL